MLLNARMPATPGALTAKSRLLEIVVRDRCVQWGVECWIRQGESGDSSQKNQNERWYCLAGLQ